MENYCERLQRQIIRRDAALARMKGNFDQAQDAVGRQIEHAKDAVNEKINQWKMRSKQLSKRSSNDFVIHTCATY